MLYLGMGSFGAGILFGEKKETAKPDERLTKEQDEIEQILAKIKTIKTEPVKIKKKKVKAVVRPIKKMTLIERIKFVLKG